VGVHEVVVETPDSCPREAAKSSRSGSGCQENGDSCPIEEIKSSRSGSGCQEN
jgi:hypothetical protein